ncbi:MAG: peroxiredoxin [Candidatus Thermoplasmatota archaeon]
MARPLAVGDKVPPFDVRDSSGKTWSSASLSGRPFVVFFYPADESPGCVKEACAFRDSWEEFEALHVSVLGVSRDDDASHSAFAQHRRLPFALLADPDGKLHAAFGAFHFGSVPRRVSFLVDAAGKVAAVFDSHLQPGSHPEAMLVGARKLTAAG